MLCAGVKADWLHATQVPYPCTIAQGPWSLTEMKSVAEVSVGFEIYDLHFSYLFLK